MSRLDEFPRCPGCGRITKPWSRKTKPCPLGELCETQDECHAQVGIGVCTLGTKCSYPEGHTGDHDYGWNACNKHPFQWLLHRQDDNGNQFLVETFTNADKAEAARKDFEAKGHKQLYWVEKTGGCSSAN